MVEDLMEGLVIDVVMGVINAETKDIRRDSDFSDLGVDQLAITYIVLELEVRLGIELPVDLEEAQTISEMAASAQQALRAAAARHRFLQGDDSVQVKMAAHVCADTRTVIDTARTPASILATIR